MKKRASQAHAANFSRRTALQMVGAGFAAAGMGAGSAAHAETEEMVRAHGYSFFGDLKYPADYPHFDYVNPNAPKGGEISLSTRGTFDGMNRFAQKGRSGLYSGLIGESMLGSAPFGSTLPADSLTDSYGLLAHTVEYPKSKTYCIFHMRPEATFSDGRPLTAKDAMFTHNLFLEQGIRSYARSVKERIAGVEVIDDHTIRYDFVEGISRRSLISQVGGTPVFSEDWYAETGERLDEPSLLTPLGSGPYVVDDFELNRYIVYKRNPDYWGYDLPINIGRHNFETVRVEYFADDAAEFEAFKAGVYTFRGEGSTKKWATAYNFPAVEEGHVKRETIPSGTPPTPSGFVFNLLREPFTDVKVREALSLGFNFEWTRDSLQFGLTTQRHSFSQGTEIEAKGKPEGLEKAFLEALGDLVPPEVYEEDAVLAHTSDPSRTLDRRNKRAALKLFEDAGWTVGDDGMLRDAGGNLMEFKVMLSSATSDTVEAIITAYTENLLDFGVSVSMEKVDSAQYASRYYDKDWDMMYFRNQPLLTVGTGLRQSYGSETAVVSSYNPQSLQDPLIDAIIDAALLAKSRDEEVAALMAMDRILRRKRMLIHAGYVAESWVASYDIFEHPEELPPLAVGSLDFWWFNQDKYDALKAKGVLR